MTRTQTWALRQRGHLMWAVVVLSALTGCASNPFFPPIPPTPPPEPIDFTQAETLATLLFDLTDNENVTDEELRSRYTGNGVTAYVLSTVFTGDTAPSRYMLIVDDIQRKQTIALAGTNTGYQWLVDFYTTPTYVPDLGTEVHGGFNIAALIVMNDVLPRLNIDYPITLTGYSLGSAIACILTRYLQIDGYEVGSVITFGQPRITDPDGIALFADVPLLRFVNGEDPIPYFPDGDYTQFGPVVVLYDGPDYAYLAPNTQDYAAAGGVGGQAPLGRTDPDGHLAPPYLSRLRSKLSDATQVPYRIEIARN